MDEREREEHKKQLMKEAMKEGMREWLDERYAVFAKWTMSGIFGAATLALFSWMMKVILAAGFLSMKTGK
jgi:hypothetical protein